MRSRGFTLVEMAVAIAVLGLLFTTMFGVWGQMHAAAQRRITRSHLDEARATLAIYVMQFGRLPCPADGALPDSDPGAGVEMTRDASGDCPNSQARGVLPWRTLSISEDLVTDGLDQRFTYRAAPGLTRDVALNFTNCDPAVPYNPLVSSAAGTAPYQSCKSGCDASNLSTCTNPLDAVKSRGFSMTDTAGAVHGDPANGSGAAYILIAHGTNGGAFGRSGALQSSTEAVGAAEATNFADLIVAASYVDGMASTAPQHFDDELRYETVLGISISAKRGPRSH